VYTSFVERGREPVRYETWLAQLLIQQMLVGSNPLLLTLARQFDKDGVMSYYNVMFNIGSIFGPTLLGIALWRARAIKGSGGDDIIESRKGFSHGSI
jgi:hypothetical protein